MVQTEVLMAGFGGQGMLLAGKILAHAAMTRGMQVSWLPSYGPEMRGGTANVTVCVSEKPIGSPLITNPRGLLVMNLPSLEKFAPKVRPGGVIVINTALVSKDAERDDCTVVKVNALELAAKAGTDRASNFVMLGAYVGATDIAQIEQELIEEGMPETEIQRLCDVHVAVFRKDEDRIYSMIYRDGRDGAILAKRFRVGGVTRDKLYELGKGTPGTRVVYFAVHATEEESSENTLLIHLKPALRLRNVTRPFQFGEIAVKGRGAKGNIITRHAIDRVVKAPKDF